MLLGLVRGKAALYTTEPVRVSTGLNAVTVLGSGTDTFSSQKRDDTALNDLQSSQDVKMKSGLSTYRNVVHVVYEKNREARVRVTEKSRVMSIIGALPNRPRLAEVPIRLTGSCT